MSELKPISECRTVAELLADKSRWTQGVEAKNNNGNPVPPRSKSAVCFCAFGAMVRIYGPNIDIESAVYKKLNDVMSPSHMGYVSGFNDTHTYEEVYAAVLKSGI